MKICSNEYELASWQKEELLCGLDEAGRGPLAGPLTVAGVIFPCGYENTEIYDSKALSEKKREKLFQIICKDALWYEIVVMDARDIDLYNIYRCDQIAMHRIAAHAPCQNILTDAMPIPECTKNIVSIIKGDQKSVSIAAASILAKVTRDRLMQYYDTVYPGYGFAKNKGYGTRQHLDAIDALSITPIHRRSFSPVSFKQLALDLSK